MPLDWGIIVDMRWYVGAAPEVQKEFRDGLISTYENAKNNGRQQDDLHSYILTFPFHLKARAGTPPNPQKQLENKLRETDPSKTYPCHICGTEASAWYTLSLKTQAIFVRCPNHGTISPPFKAGLDLPMRPSKDYLRAKGKLV